MHFVTSRVQAGRQNGNPTRQRNAHGSTARALGAQFRLQLGGSVCDVGSLWTKVNVELPGHRPFIAERASRVPDLLRS